MTRHFEIIDAEQRSERWFAARLGRLTGSVAGEMVAKVKSGAYSTSRENLLMRLAIEQLTGEGQEEIKVTKEMQRGIDKEPDAIAAYEAATGELIRVTGFLSHTTAMAGCSLDGHIGDFAGIVEMKCPLPSTQFKYLRSGAIPEDYMPQILHNLWITGAAWCDFVSFDDRLPEHLQLFIKRYQRNDAEVQDYANQAHAFLVAVQDRMNALKTMNNPSDQLKAALA